MSLRSTTFRFALLVFLCQLIAAAVLLVGLGAILREQSTSRAEASAEAMRDDLLAAYAQGGAGELAREIQLRRTQAIRRGGVMLLADGSGRPIAGNLTRWPGRIGPNEGYAELALYQAGHVAPETMLVRATRLPGGERLLTGIVIEDERQILGMLGRASALALALGLLIAILFAWLTARVIAARLGTTVETLRAVRDGDLARRVPRDGSGDAFAALGGEVNYALDRATTLIDELKIATDSLAHDLKSPLTRLRAALERAADAADTPAALGQVERAMAESDRLQGLVETALSISRAEGGIGRESFAETDLTELLLTMAEIYAPLVEDGGRTITVDAPARCPWPVHRQLLGQAIGNLIDNSVKYGAGAITLALTDVGGRPRIAVADRGPGIPAGRRADALRRFGRLDTARQEAGAGLGLTLAQAVAHLHSGSLSLHDAEPGLLVAIELG